MSIGLHIGIDTVELGGRFFETHVSAGQAIRQGDLLISFDKEGIRKAGYKTTTPMVICNTDDYRRIEISGAEKATTAMRIIKIR